MMIRLVFSDDEQNEFIESKALQPENEEDITELLKDLEKNMLISKVAPLIRTAFGIDILDDDENIIDDWHVTEEGVTILRWLFRMKKDLHSYSVF